MSGRFVALSGCSGGGKSSLLAELGRRGFVTVEEPGRRIVREELRACGNALPWVDLAAFAHRAIETALQDFRAAEAGTGWVFFDRGLVDAACALQHATGAPLPQELLARHRYHQSAFLVPPWREIFVSDGERPHGFDAACEEYARLERAYAEAGYRTVILPRVSIRERVEYLIARLPELQV